jgi:hypothetical protein
MVAMNTGGDLGNSEFLRYKNDCDHTRRRSQMCGSPSLCRISKLRGSAMASSKNNSRRENLCLGFVYCLVQSVGRGGAGEL